MTLSGFFIDKGLIDGQGVPPTIRVGVLEYPHHTEEDTLQTGQNDIEQTIYIVLTLFSHLVGCANSMPLMVAGVVSHIQPQLSP